MATNDTVELLIRGTVFGQLHEHTLHFRYEDPVVSTEADLIADWQANCRTAYRNCFSNTDLPVVLLRAAQVCGTPPLRAAVEVAEAGATQAGTLTYTSNRSPSWLASVTSLRTAFAGPSRRGRFYLGGLYEEVIGGNNVDAAFITNNLTVYAQALLTRYGPSGTSTRYLWVVHSRKLASVPGTQCQDSSTPITSFLVNPALGTMKSRKVGSGT